MKLTLFDLDHTVLNGDSDVLWCDFLIDKGVLGRTEFTARNADMAARYKFDIEHLIATEPEMLGSRFTGSTTGVLNMREGKVERLHAWLTARGLRFKDCKTTAYSDSINDLPLLEAVKHPVTVNADATLAAIGGKRGWPALQLH
jgi:phosphoserine phosphatase